MIEDELQAWFRSGLEAAASELGLDGELPEPEVMEPRQKEHGDFATNVAMRSAKAIGRPPRELAQELAEKVVELDEIERASCRERV